MNPPPPILPFEGEATASANAVATAASTALPPRPRIAAPVSAAMSEDETTIPAFDGTPKSTCAPTGAKAITVARARVNVRTLRMTGSLPKV